MLYLEKAPFSVSNANKIIVSTISGREVESREESRVGLGVKPNSSMSKQNLANIEAPTTIYDQWHCLRFERSITVCTRGKHIFLAFKRIIWWNASWGYNAHRRNNQSWNWVDMNLSYGGIDNNNTHRRNKQWAPTKKANKTMIKWADDHPPSRMCSQFKERHIIS